MRNLACRVMTNRLRFGRAWAYRRKEYFSTVARRIGGAEAVHQRALPLATRPGQIRKSSMISELNWDFTKGVSGERASVIRIVTVGASWRLATVCSWSISANRQILS